MTKRINHHKIIIEGIREHQSGVHAYRTPLVTEFHTTTMRRMPANLIGVPDLAITWHWGTLWVEIKPKYKKGRRDKLNDRQCRFAYDMYPLVSGSTRYWIVSDADDFTTAWQRGAWWHVDDFHAKTIANWCERRGTEVPWLARWEE